PARGAAATREAASIRETATPRTAGTPARRPVSPGRHPPGGPTSAAPWRGSKRRLMVGVDDPDDDQDGDDDQPYGQAAEQDRIVLGALRGAALPLLGIAGQDLDYVVDAARDAAGKVVRAEARDDSVLDDELRHRVRQRTLEPVADLDPHLALVRRDQE